MSLYLSLSLSIPLVTLVTLVTLLTLISKVHTAQIGLKLHQNPSPTLPPDQGFSPNFHEFVNQCLIKDNSRRASMTQLLSLPFLSDPNSSSHIPLNLNKIKTTSINNTEYKNEYLKESDSGKSSRDFDKHSHAEKVSQSSPGVARDNVSEEDYRSYNTCNDDPKASMTASSIASTDSNRSGGTARASTRVNSANSTLATSFRPEGSESELRSCDSSQEHSREHERNGSVQSTDSVHSTGSVSDRDSLAGNTVFNPEGLGSPHRRP